MELLFFWILYSLLHGRKTTRFIHTCKFWINGITSAEHLSFFFLIMFFFSWRQENFYFEYYVHISTTQISLSNISSIINSFFYSNVIKFLFDFWFSKDLNYLDVRNIEKHVYTKSLNARPYVHKAVCPHCAFKKSIKFCIEVKRKKIPMIFWCGHLVLIEIGITLSKWRTVIAIFLLYI